MTLASSPKLTKGLLVVMVPGEGPIRGTTPANPPLSRLVEGIVEGPKP